MKTIKEKAKEYAKTKHTDRNLIKIVSWDFEAGANYVLEQIESLTKCTKWKAQELYYLIEKLKGNQ